METHRLVRPEDLNQYGHLFGGRLLAWVDEAAWIAASLEHPGARLVTLALDEVIFRHPVEAGDILTLLSERQARGRTSVTYRVRVRRNEGEDIFSTRITFVNVSAEGRKQALPGGESE